jgi:hypothetical protein
MTGFAEEQQLVISTADDERNYFTVAHEVAPVPASSPVLPPGVYRVVNGDFFRIVDATPPAPDEKSR